MWRILYLRNEGEVPEQEGKTRWIRQDYLEELIKMTKAAIAKFGGNYLVTFA